MSAASTTATTSETGAKPSITAIVAATQSNGIGLNGGLPWRLPGEMKYFARVTTGEVPAEQLENENTNTNTVIMGRKTWESIPARFRPLKNRRNLVISSKGVDISQSPNTESYSSLESALDSLSPADHPDSASSSGKTRRNFLIGGSQLYKTCLTSTPPLVDRVLLTRVISDFQCDAFLEDFTKHTSTSTSDHSSKSDAGGLIWKKATHEELQDWLGFTVDEINEEKGVEYRYEMWVLNTSTDTHSP
ncbi:uncharacterized protein I303_102177 [Kwoniella dejecticola CBS 10117]|uniref:Dihydrofolate reductase n=1 Tax=Kwoniella dejecticola CBS 10117 TaxID=1296121 RepID=A0A1A6ABR1_9TREE|nr:uncharacterized protein I303_01683 [Kwoniella dejecticola CBS 10117]OBR87478.1 hypothetical protein I303_01683 [Kwoniella dejecticola CBS 10117]